MDDSKESQNVALFVRSLLNFRVNFGHFTLVASELCGGDGNLGDGTLWIYLVS